MEIPQFSATEITQDSEHYRIAFVGVICRRTQKVEGNECERWKISTVI